MKVIPEKNPKKPTEAQGVFRKFYVRRVDGSHAPGGKHHGCRYFVLDLDHDPHAAVAMAAYAQACRATHPMLSAELEAEYPSAKAVRLPSIDLATAFHCATTDQAGFLAIQDAVLRANGFNDQLAGD